VIVLFREGRGERKEACFAAIAFTERERPIKKREA